MDIEKLIEQLNEYFEGKELGRGAALDAATALSTFQAENEKLRAELEQKSKLIAQQAAELERRDTLLKEQEAELERMKEIMRENGIMVIPPKYPGGTALGVTRDRLRELIQADNEGRCVVLPCKVGRKVKVDVRTWGNIWNYKTVDHGKFLIGEIVAMVKTKKQTLLKIRVEHNVSWKRPTKRYPASAIGKTVLLDRQEAALRREQDG